MGLKEDEKFLENMKSKHGQEQRKQKRFKETSKSANFVTHKSTN